MTKSPHDHVLGRVPGLNISSLESRQITRKIKLRRKNARSRDRAQLFCGLKVNNRRVRKLMRHTIISFMCDLYVNYIALSC